jgi:hypothetical protein
VFGAQDIFAYCIRRLPTQEGESGEKSGIVIDIVDTDGNVRGSRGDSVDSVDNVLIWEAVIDALYRCQLEKKAPEGKELL